MIYNEIVGNLFTAPEDYYLAQCISADFAMGKGIAVQFNQYYNMKNVLLNKYPNYLERFISENLIGDCILEGRVLNLVTKERYYQKPKTKNMVCAVLLMRKICEDNNIHKIAMPMIGCGLDNMEWNKVRDTIIAAFEDDEDIDIRVYKLK